jgi:hypothetical protein
MGRHQHIFLNPNIFGQEFNRLQRIGSDASHFRRSHKYVFRLLGGKKSIHGDCIGKVKLCPGARNEVGVAFGGQNSD